jgi:hypothetical protein
MLKHVLGSRYNARLRYGAENQISPSSPTKQPGNVYQAEVCSNRSDTLSHVENQCSLRPEEFVDY